MVDLSFSVETAALLTGAGAETGSLMVVTEGLVQSLFEDLGGEAEEASIVGTRRHSVTEVFYEVERCVKCQKHRDSQPEQKCKALRLQAEEVSPCLRAHKRMRE